MRGFSFENSDEQAWSERPNKHYQIYGEHNNSSAQDQKINITTSYTQKYQQNHKKKLMYSVNRRQQSQQIIKKNFLKSQTTQNFNSPLKASTNIKQQLDNQDFQDYLDSSSEKRASAQNLNATNQLLSFLENQGGRKQRYVFRKPIVNVLIIYAGGTIGMQKTQRGLSVRSNFLAQLFKSHSQLYDTKYVTEHYGPDSNQIITPVTSNKHRIRVNIHQISKIQDSSNVDTDTWVEIGKIIGQNYTNYDSFLILHGTDTMSYTASVLSFCLQDLRRTVVITGAMLPIIDCRSDGYENLIGALLVAGSYWIPQVLVYFNNKLLRGNRTIKISCQDKFAFSSPNFDNIGELGVNIKINWRLVLKPLNEGNFNVFTRLQSKISSLQITPMMHEAIFQAAFNPLFDAVVIQGYAMGNFPSKKKQLTDIIMKALKDGTIVVITSQVNKGVVIDTYQVLKDFVQAGALISYDMTFPCVLAKLSYLLGKFKNNKKKIKELFVKNLRGQLTDMNQDKNLFSNGKFVCAVAQVLNTSLPEEFQSIAQDLNPYFVNAIASRGDETTMHALKIGGFDFDQIDIDGNSPLHQAAKWGKIDIVKFLCKKGVDLNFSNEIQPHSPLALSIIHKRYDCARYLRKKGANFIMLEPQYGNLLCQIGMKGDVKMLQALHQCGITLNVSNFDNRTIGHLAVSFQNYKILQYLLQYQTKYDFNIKDRWNMTVLNYLQQDENSPKDLIHKIRVKSQIFQNQIFQDQHSSSPDEILFNSNDKFISVNAADSLCMNKQSEKDEDEFDGEQSICEQMLDEKTESL